MSLSVQSFAPVIDAKARVLVLGSMPGVVSLSHQQYYAHPRNAFWPIMATVCGFDIRSNYADRCEALSACGIALWDVLQTCERPGSLDSSIKADSIIPNDFHALFTLYPGIERVCFNGAKAADVYRRRVEPHLIGIQPLQYISLPSTSPAHAALSMEKKREIWEAAING